MKEVILKVENKLKTQKIIGNLPVELDIIVLFFMIVFLSVLQLRGIDIFTIIILSITDFVLCIYDYSKTVKCKKITRKIYLVVNLTSVLCIFYILANHYKHSWKNIGPDHLMIPFFFLFALFTVQGLLVFAIGIKSYVTDRILENTKCQRLLILGGYFLSVVVLNLGWMDSWPQYDNYTYANDLNKIYLSNVFQESGLLVCGHVSDLFALAFLILKILPLNFINILYLLNIILMFGNMLLFDGIIRKLFSKQTVFFYVIATLMFAVSPSVLGSIYIICPEKVLFWGFLLYLYGYLYRNKSVQFFAAYVICTAKETGIVVIALCTAIELVLKIILYIKNKERNSFAADMTYFLCVLGLGILCLLRILSTAWVGGTALGNERLSLDGYKWNSFALSLSQGICVFKATFLTNFTWIFLCLFLLGITKCIWDWKKGIIEKKQIKNFTDKYLIIIICCITFFGLLCVYITGVRWRYYTPICIFLYLLGLFGLDYFLKNFKNGKIISTVCVSFIGVLLFIQSYITIDPIMLKVFNTLDTGNAKIAVMEQNCSWLYDKTCSVATEYNQQIHSFTKSLDKALNRVLAENQFACVLFSDEHKIADNNAAVTSIWGLGYEYASPPRWTHWDYDNEQRYLSEEEAGHIPVDYINLDTDLNRFFKEYEQVYYIEMPWGDSVIQNIDEAVYVDSVAYMGWELKIYQIFREKI